MRHFTIVLALLVTLWTICTKAFAAAMPPADPAVALLAQKIKFPAAGAHQGGIDWGLMNTIPNFENAREQGVDIVEMDLRISADHVPVVFHDENLNFWTYCRGPVRSKTVDQLKTCEFKKNWKPRIPTFEEVLQWSAGRIVINAEFKDAETIAPALALVDRYNAYSWVYFQTQGSWEKYHAARLLNPRVALLFSPKNRTDLELSLKLIDPNLVILEIDKSFANPTDIAKIHAAGYLVSIDSFDFDPIKEYFKASCNKAYVLGIDIAISNRPESCVHQRTDHKDEL